MKVSRRTFFSSIGAATALSLPALSGNAQPQDTTTAMADSAPDIIDTNVNLFQWPFRRLKYGETKALVAKLRQHKITQAWTGGYDGLFHKNINGVNARLAEECKANGEGMLLPFGTVNVAWPDWEEDLRRCREVHGMRGIRICPIYQTFDLAHPDFSKLVRQATALGLAIQIVGDMEDLRTHHPIIQVREMNAAPLVDILKKVPQAKVQLLHWNHRVGRDLLDKLIKETSVVLDISAIEGTGEVGRLIEGKTWSGSARPVPVERFLFGSNAPYFPVETNLLKLFESPLTLEQMQAIMNGNARRFLQSS
jgi:predicted TIM-barrel fold metal-dependent hydrolase